MRLRRTILVLLVVLPVLVYAKSLTYPFINFDDPVYVTQSPIVQSEGVSGLVLAWSRPYFHDYIPITQTTLWLDGQLGAMSPLPFRIQSLAWHVLAGLLVFFAARRWTASEGMAGATALMFAVHPLAVESVAWISARKNVVSLVLFLAAYLTWARGEDKPSVIAHRIVAGFFFLAALLAKSASVGFPIVVFADSMLLRKRPARRAFLDALPYALIAVICLIFMLALRSDLPEERLTGAIGTIALDLQVLARYLINTVIPVRLSAFYYLDLRGFASPATWAAIGCLALGLAAPFFWIRRRRRAAFLLVWMLAGLLPAFNLIPQPHPIADRFFHWSLPGLICFLVIAAADALSVALGWLERSRGHRTSRSVSALVPALVALAVITGLVGAAGLRTRVWRSALVLFEDAVRKSPSSSVAHMHLGNILANSPSAVDKRRGASEFRIMLACPDSELRLKQVAKDGGTMFISQMDHADGMTQQADERMAAHFAGRESRPDVRLLLAQYELATGRPESVISRLEPLILQNSTLVEFGHSLVRSQEMPYRRRVSEMTGAWDIYLAGQQQQGITQTLTYLGKAYLEADRPLDAAVALSLLCAFTGPDPALVQDLGRAYEAAGYPQRAAVCYRDAEHLRAQRAAQPPVRN
jgi:hypothetical protein